MHLYKSMLGIWMQMACTLVNLPPLHYVVSFAPRFFILLVLVLICFFLLGFAKKRKNCKGYIDSIDFKSKLLFSSLCKKL
ncbi:hypothetical protein RHMOL_Rhmol10G0036800 [Rhododendron molle]|uniref:Uncharacterized protein n=1 Tax=Rhododendron molle TaxID=49168 RepID=A0ACC0LYQ1_RHOML|nr:hypothetical protein RHMOL_Rhmol10G0036800 [Rhododendron molle]